MSPAELPFVSVLTPVYNYGRYLGRTLDSALAQDYPPERMEIVVVDDGSTDETPDVIAAYAEAHPGRIRSCRQENQGFIAATNATMREARGDLWAFLDSDDIWPVEKTREQVEIMRAHPSVGAVYSDTELIGPHEEPLESSVWALYTQKPIVGPDCEYRMCSEPSGNPALNSTIMVRAALAERFAPIPDGVPYVDWWVMARVAAVAELATSRSRVGYRTHGANITLGATGQRAVREILKAVQMRRQLVLRGAADTLSTRQLVTVLQVLEQAAGHTASLAGTVFLPLVEPSPAERAQGERLAARAQQATLAGDWEIALRHRALAVIANPWDADSREWLGDLAAFALEGLQLADELEQARGTIVLAFLEELEREPALLGAFANEFGPDDDVTLAVNAAALTERTALDRIGRVISRAGIEVATMPDALLVARHDDEEPTSTAGTKLAAARQMAVEVDLERRAAALLSRRPARLGVAAYDGDRVAQLRADIAGAVTLS